MEEGGSFGVIIFKDKSYYKTPQKQTGSLVLFV